MPELWKPLLALFGATLISVVGTILIRIASDSYSIPVAIIGASMWGMSAAGFVFASSRGLDLGTAAALMSAGGILAIQLVGILFGEQMTTPKLIALALIFIAIILLALPTSQS